MAAMRLPVVAEAENDASAPTDFSFPRLPCPTALEIILIPGFMSLAVSVRYMLVAASGSTDTIPLAFLIPACSRI